MFMSALKSPPIFSVQNSIVAIDFDAMENLTLAHRLARTIAAGKYDFVDLIITPEKFPVVGTGVKTFRPRLFHFDRTTPSKDVERLMKKDDFKPGTFIHGLAFGAVYPDEQRRYRIGCLGSTSHLVFGQRAVICLDSSPSGRVLLTKFWDDDWENGTRFLGVQELFAA